jgi:predicted RNA binding protein YcfA (HicA-like mRNA interferase family)
MPPVLSSKDVVKALEKMGFAEASQKGSHKKLKHIDGRSVIVPMHKEISPGTLRSIAKQAKTTMEEIALNAK